MAKKVKKAEELFAAAESDEELGACEDGFAIMRAKRKAEG